MIETPVLLLVFNRPEQTRRVFSAVRAAQPKRLFVRADGPRTDKAGEAELCREVRDIFDNIDWPCQLETNFSTENLGCRDAVSGGITWFFEQVEAGIILEDDCLPHPSFFNFCSELLARYAHDERVMMLSGNNFGAPLSAASYAFSRFPFIWGWATWRRAWQQYDKSMSQLAELTQTRRGFLDFLPDRLAQNYLLEKMQLCQNGQLNTWDYQWFYTIVHRGGLTVIPSVNMVENIGFGVASTHTSGSTSRLILAANEMPFPLQHPDKVHLIATEASQKVFYSVYKNWLSLRLRWLISFIKTP